MSIILNKLKKEAIIYCPLCQKQYKPIDMRMVDQTGETLLTHSQCPNCEGAVLSLVFSDLMGVNIIGMVTDLNYEDAIRLKSEGHIENDDVLEIYEKLSFNTNQQNI